MSKEHLWQQDVYNAISELSDSLYNRDKADATNWTTADSLSNIYFEIKRIADILETMNNK